MPRERRFIRSLNICMLMFYKYEMKVNEDFNHRLHVDSVYVSVSCAVAFRFSIIVNYVLISGLFHIYVLYTILYALISIDTTLHKIDSIDFSTQFLFWLQFSHTG